MILKNYRLSLTAVGLIAATHSNATANGPGSVDVANGSPLAPAEPALVEVFRSQHVYTLADHRSHSSHRSHASHRSSTGGGAWTAPAPSRSYSAPQSLYEAPFESPKIDESIAPSTGQDALKATPLDFTEHVAFVEKAQAMLFARGFYQGAMDGVVGVDTREAIIKFETAKGQSPTGRVTRRLLADLGLDPSTAFKSGPYLKTLPGNSTKFKRIVEEVQVVLYVYGYYGDAIDGVVGPRLKAAISAFQRDYGVKETGTLTPETLDAMHVTAN